MNEDEDLVEEKWSRDSWVLGAIVGAILLAFIAISLVYVKGIFDRAAEQKSRDEFISCVRNWSDAYTRRADLLQTLSTARTDALDARTRAEDRFLRRLLANPKAFHRELLNLLYADQDYLDASDAYRRAQHNHPVPASPQFVCSHGKQGVAPGDVTGDRPTPRATTSRPPTSRLPTSRPSSSPAASRAPGQPGGPTRSAASTRTVSAPPATRIRTRTRPAPPPVTRTVTRSASSSPPTPRPGGVLPSIVCGLNLPLVCP